jgi:hypothetical protein
LEYWQLEPLVPVGQDEVTLMSSIATDGSVPDPFPLLRQWKPILTLGLFSSCAGNVNVKRVHCPWLYPLQAPQQTVFRQYRNAAGHVTPLSGLSRSSALSSEHALLPNAIKSNPKTTLVRPVVLRVGDTAKLYVAFAAADSLYPAPVSPPVPAPYPMCRDWSFTQLLPQAGASLPFSAQLTYHVFGELPLEPSTLFTTDQPLYDEARQLAVQELLKDSVHNVLCAAACNEKNTENTTAIQ